MNKRQSNIPKIAERFAKVIFKPGITKYVSGDLEEEFKLIENESNRKRAIFWYWKQIILSFLPYLIGNIRWSLTMFKSYMKIAVRNLRKFKTYSIINIFSLMIGIAFCLLIAVLSLWESSYNRFHENADILYRIRETQYEQDHTNVILYSAAPLGPELKNNYPEVVDYMRFAFQGDLLFKYEDKKFYENSVICADRSFFQLFTFPLVKGDKNFALNEPDAVLIDETTAKKYFGDADPMGKVIKIDNRYDFFVKGVFKDIPENSTYRFRIVLPWEFIQTRGWFKGETWNNVFCVTFLLLDEDSDVKKFENKISNVINEHTSERRADISLQSLADIHLQTVRNGTKGTDALFLSAFIGFFILLISCINFMNLSTARSSYRFKEIGVRKIVGGTKKDLIFQFFGESLLLSFISLFLAILLIEPLLYILYKYTGIHLTLNVTKNWILLPIMLGITFVTGILAASYPAVYLSSFSSLNILKGVFHSGKKSLLFRRVLVTAQFSLTIIFMICGFISSKQFEYLMNYDMGWDRENLMYITMRGEISASYDKLKNELIRSPSIRNVAASGYTPLYFYSSTSDIKWAGKDLQQTIHVTYNYVDPDFVETIKAEMVEGGRFSIENGSNNPSYIINETLAEIIGKDPIIGENITIFGRPGEIIGVVKDFNCNALKSRSQPMVLISGDNNYFPLMLIKLNPGNRTSAIDFITSTWKKIVPDHPLEYRFIEDELYEMYNDEGAMGITFKVITLFTLLITILGLMALIAFITEKKKKEIGVRKVLGASSSTIVRLISKEYFILIIVSNVIALPAAFFFMKTFLSTYAFRTEQGLGIYILSGLSILTAGLLTVIYQVFKVSTTNPADSLRCE
ncbi:ABC transporter permease [candidate division KSB1 bacterium]